MWLMGPPKCAPREPTTISYIEQINQISGPIKAAFFYKRNDRTLYLLCSIVIFDYSIFLSGVMGRRIIVIDRKFLDVSLRGCIVCSKTLHQRVIVCNEEKW